MGQRWHGMNWELIGRWQLTLSGLTETSVSVAKKIIAPDLYLLEDL